MTTIPALLLLITSIIPWDVASVSYVDAVELNHYYDGNGRAIFSQLIFWQRERVKDWRIVKPSCSQILRRNTDGWSLTFVDLKCGDIIRKVYASDYRVIHSQVDREIENRNKWPTERRNLFGRGK